MTCGTLKRLLLGLLLTLSPSAALAQETANDEARTSAGPLDRFGTIGGTRLQLSAGTEDDTASIGLELPSAPSQATRFGMILSTPLNGEDEASPATLDGLANGTTLTLRWGQFLLYPLRGRPSERMVKLVERGRDICRTRATTDEDRKACNTEVGNNIVGRYLNDEENREYNVLSNARDARNFGLEASVGRNEFEFVDPNTLAELSETHLQWRVRGYYEQYLRGSKTALSFSAAYERAYEAEEEEIFCPASSGASPSRCITARGAPPELNESLLISAGLRHQFMINRRLRNVATAPLITYDALDDVWGVDVPVYFIPGSEGGLTGGARFGYRSDRDDEFSFGIFIGAAFSILN